MLEFPETSWSLVKRASTAGDPDALEEFAKRYYLAVRAFIRVMVRDEDLAQDFTQEFFQERVLRSRGVLAQANAARGRFRPFLKQTIRNFLADKHRAGLRAARADVRPDAIAGGWESMPLDRADAADRALLREWGQSIVTTAIERVKQISVARGQDEHFAMFAQRHLGDPQCQPGFREIGLMFGLDEKTARGRVQTVLNHFRAQLEELLLTDAGAEGDVDQEIRTLISLL